jgi:SARP family transcriptional regulator, regulator of embCAB operon
MDVQALGPLQIREAEHSILPTAGKPRQLLALLALNPDRLVTVATLMEEIWGERPPRSAATTLQTYILHLRRLLTAALGENGARRPKDVLVTTPGGYLLRVAPGEVDAELFTARVAEGRREFNRGGYDRASRLLREALGLWRGSALADIAVGRILELDVMALEEARISALECRIEADIRRGLSGELVGELRVLAARHPLNEHFHAQLMLAFYRSGNAGRALEAYQTLRRTLREELGLEPSGAVRQLQQAILSGDLSAGPGMLRPVGV